MLAIGDSLNGNYGDEQEKGTEKGTKAKKRKATKNNGVVKGKRTITLEVTPGEAEQLALAQAKGEIVLALRADIDINRVEENGVIVDELIGLERYETPPRPMKSTQGKSNGKNAANAAPTNGAQVIQGSSTTGYTVGEDGKVIEDKGRKGR